MDEIRNPIVALVAVCRFAARSGRGSPFHSLGRTVDMARLLNRPKRSDAWRWIALSVVPLAVVLFQASVVSELFKTAKWPEVQATVVWSSVEMSCIRGPQYSTAVKISYSFREVEHTSDVDFFDAGCASFEDASRTAALYVPGSSVTARVNPEHPNQSTLAAPGFALDAKLSIGFFSAVFFMSIGLAARAYRGAA